VSSPVGPCAGRWAGRAAVAAPEPRGLVAAGGGLWGEDGRCGGEVESRRVLDE